LLDALITESPANATLCVQEYVLTRQWLQMMSFRDPASDKTYLSEEEFDTVLDCCLKDITHGMAYVQQSSLVDGQAPVDFHVRQAEPVLYWGTGLIILI